MTSAGHKTQMENITSVKKLEGIRPFGGPICRLGDEKVMKM